jgi:hypothetical protein
MSPAFVTGGSGFVGGRLIEWLRAEEHAARVLARSDSAAERVRSLGAEAVTGEFADCAAVRPAPRTAASPSMPPRRWATLVLVSKLLVRTSASFRISGGPFRVRPRGS